jgi:hypothetical protein
MSVKKSPLQSVNERFGSKEKLVDALCALPAKVLERGEDEDKEAFRKRLLAAANSKLIRLYNTSKTIEERWGGKEQLVEALLQMRNRLKDKDYRSKLLTYPIGRLFDQFRSAERAQRRAADKSA